MSTQHDIPEPRPGVKLASFSDIPRLVELIGAFYQESGLHIDGDAATAVFRDLLGDPTLGAAWLLRDGHSPAGYLVLTVCFSMESGGMTGFVDDLYVRPEYRGRGLGKAALEAAFDECRRRGVRTLQVVVGAESDTAAGLYAAYGFEYPQDGRQTLKADVPPDRIP